MEDFPSNSQRSAPKEVRKETKKDQDEKKITPVVTTEAKRRKKPLGRRFKETFVGGEDARGVWNFVVMDIMIPAVKDMISDAVSQGIDRRLFGDSRPRSRSRGHGSSPNGYVSYNSIGTRPASYRSDSRRDMSQRGRARHDFDEIILDSRADAEEVIDRLFDLVERFDTASVADLYELTNITGNHTDVKWGWTDLRGARVDRVREGYLLKLPKPEPLD